MFAKYTSENYLHFYMWEFIHLYTCRNTYKIYIAHMKREGTEGRKVSLTFLSRSSSKAVQKRIF